MTELNTFSHHISNHIKISMLILSVILYTSSFKSLKTVFPTLTCQEGSYHRRTLTAIIVRFETWDLKISHYSQVIATDSYVGYRDSQCRVLQYLFLWIIHCNTADKYDNFLRTSRDFLTFIIQPFQWCWMFLIFLLAEILELAYIFMFLLSDSYPW